MTAKRLVPGLVLGAVLAGAPGLVLAQDITAIQPAPEYSKGFNTAVRERAHPEWAPIGIHAGSFRLQPEVIGNVVFTDNEQDVTTGARSDVIFQIDPRVSFSSDWSRHGLAGDVWYTRNQNTRITSDSSNEYGGSLGGKLDIYNDLNFTARYEAAHVADPSSDPDAPTNRSERPMIDRQIGRLALTKSLPRVQFQGVVNYLDLSYNDFKSSTGTTVSQSARDSRYVNAVGKATYAMSPEFGIFVGGLVDQTSRPKVGALSLDSNGFTLGGGANFDLSRLARGEIQLGYFRESYDGAGFKADSGLNVQADVQYFPTQLTTLNFSLARSALTGGRYGTSSVISSGAVANAPGGTALSAGASVDHELLRNLILSANIATGRSDYTGIDRRDRSFATGFGATYLMNRRIGLDLSYQYRSFDSSGRDARRSYDENRLWLTVRLSY